MMKWIGCVACFLVGVAWSEISGTASQVGTQIAVPSADGSQAQPETSLQLRQGQLALGPYALGMTVADAEARHGEVAAEVSRRVPALRIAEHDPLIKGNKSFWTLPADPLQTVLIGVREGLWISRGCVNGFQAPDAVLDLELINPSQ